MSGCYRPGGMHWPHNGEFNLDYEDSWNTLSVYEKLCYIKAKLDENNTSVQAVIDQLALKEDKDNLTLVRLLSELGDFTGTWFGESYNSIIARIQNGEILYQDVIDLIESNPQLNIEIIDGGFYLDGLTPDIVDCGNFTDAPTEEIDCGNFQCSCD